MCRLITIGSIIQPALDCCQIEQAMFSGMAQNIIENQTIHFARRTKISFQRLSQKLSSRLQR